MVVNFDLTEYIFFYQVLDYCTITSILIETNKQSNEFDSVNTKCQDLFAFSISDIVMMIQLIRCTKRNSTDIIGYVII